jgi:hypothetical protein
MRFLGGHRTPHRTQRSSIDRQAINAACHLLLSAVWLERRMAVGLVTLAERSDTRRKGVQDQQWRTVAAR